MSVSNLLKRWPQLLQNSRVITCRRQQHLFFDGDEYRGPYIVRNGLFKVYNQSEDGRENVLHMFGMGEFLAWVPLFTGEPDYHSTCQCLQNGEVLFLPEENLRNLMYADGKLCFELSARTMQYAVRLKQRMNAMLLQSTEERVLDYFRELGAVQEPVALPVAKQELAQLLGMKPETLSRVLRHLCEEGRLKRSGDAYTVPVRLAE